MLLGRSRRGKIEFAAIGSGVLGNPMINRANYMNYKVLNERSL